MLGNISGNHYKFFNWEDRNMIMPNHVTDVSIEILMTGLSEAKMKEYFYKKENVVQNGAEESGIKYLFKDIIPDDLYKSQKIDEFVFDPFGYSMNAVFGKSYFTIHVTPQNICSYASFETNVDLKDYSELTGRILEIFQPSDFMVVIVDTPDITKNKTDSNLSWRRAPKTKPKYRRNERCQYEFDTYNVSYISFTSQKDVPTGKRGLLTADGQDRCKRTKPCLDINSVGEKVANGTQ